MRTIYHLAMRVGRATVFLVGLAVTLAVVFGVATVALAAVPGDPFRLGKVNTINALTSLVGGRAGGAMLLVDNNAAANGSRALDLRVEPGRAPMTVSPSAGKATNLNADKVDGRDAPLWAVVNRGGSIAASHGATSVMKPGGSQIYHVFFDRDVSGCAKVVTPTFGSMGDVSAENLQGFANGVDVFVVNDSATGVAFSLAVFC